MLALLGVGQAHPDTVIDNAFLESLDIGTTNEWIVERVGIETRRTVLPLDYIRQTRNRDVTAATEAMEITLNALGAQAAQAAIQSAGIKPEDVGLVIAGTCTPQLGLPAHACEMAALLGINAPAFDINSACSTAVAQFHFLNSMRLEQLPDYILLIQADLLTTVTNYNDRNTAVLFGDGAAAQIISPRHAGKAEIVTSLFDSDPANFNKVITPVHGHFFQEGSAVQRFAITQTVQSFQKLQEKVGFSQEAYFIGHQANLRMLESSCKRMGVPENRHFYNVNRYGNCGGSGAPTVLAEHWHDFKSGDDLALVAVGAGLSWGGAVFRFGERYHNPVDFWHFDCAKDPGLDDCKSPHISNIGRLAIAQPRELSRGPNVKNRLDYGIT